MFDYFEGILVFLDSNFIVVDIQRIGYKIFITETWLLDLKSFVNKTIKVFVSSIIKETEQFLYGFQSREQRNYFNVLISVSGIGPRIALAILSLFSCREILNAVQKKNASIFSSVSGVGKRTSEKLILDLEGKLPMMGVEHTSGNMSLSHFNDALAALIQLGYSRSVAEKLLQNVFKRLPEEADLSMILKEALRKN